MNYELRPLGRDSVSVAGDGQPAGGDGGRSRLLLEISNAVVSELELEGLLRAIFDCLRQVFRQTTAATISIYDPESDQLRVHVLHSPQPETFREGMPIQLEGTPSGLAFTSRRAVLIHRLSLEDFPDPLIKRAFADGVRSGCSVPLVSHDRVLGTITVGASREAAYSAEDAELLTEVARQVAMPVENALNYRRAERERDRARLVLEASNAIVSNLDLRDLLVSTSACLRKYFKHDFLGLSLYDEETGQLRLHALDTLPDGRFIEDGAPIPMEGTPAGLAFASRRPVVRDRLSVEEFPAETVRMACESGLRSGCAIPLISRERVLGVVAVASRREAAFTREDVELLQHIANEVAVAVENVLQYREIAALKNKLAREKLYLEEEIQTEYNFAEIVGQSAALKRVLHQAATVAPTDSVVLICGETGTGKELIARAIHNLSGRRARTLVKLNCAAIPTGLLESELFGHEKGAFTGAIAQRVGRFELAHQGTLLLDEVGEIPLELQPKLLRVLQEREFERLGSSRTVRVDARLIAATNCDLRQMVSEKRFRPDLFYRLNVFPVVVPPLRERAEDIPLLVGYFAQKHARRMNKQVESVPAEAMRALCDYHWPGNVRELENFIERACILSNGPELTAPLAELRPPAGAGGAAAAGRLLPLEEVERAHIEEVLRHTGGAVAGRGGAAEILGLPASTLRARIKKLGVKSN
ncbi:MAG TPA: sigma 54-interacting transcriptional regulator [Pyrinomonadaceae bacterium]|nr:sigma 54-interacting transcriptional regulator [Pyrinomonadaceae bacterium]